MDINNPDPGRPSWQPVNRAIGIATIAFLLFGPDEQATRAARRICVFTFVVLPILILIGAGIGWAFDAGYLGSHTSNPSNPVHSR